MHFSVTKEEEEIPGVQKGRDRNQNQESFLPRISSTSCKLSYVNSPLWELDALKFGVDYDWKSAFWSLGVGLGHQP